MASCTVLLHRDLTHTHVLKLLHNRGEDEGRNHVVVTITLLRPWKRRGHTPYKTIIMDRIIESKGGNDYDRRRTTEERESRKRARGQ